MVAKANQEWFTLKRFGGVRQQPEAMFWGERSAQATANKLQARTGLEVRVFKVEHDTPRPWRVQYRTTMRVAPALVTLLLARR